jgi:hypothetical protein
MNARSYRRIAAVGKRFLARCGHAPELASELRKRSRASYPDHSCETFVWHGLSLIAVRYGIFSEVPQ